MASGPGESWQPQAGKPEGILKIHSLGWSVAMNYHYIDYMIKQRRQDEISACENRRRLRKAGYDAARLEKAAFIGLIGVLGGFIRRRGFSIKNLLVPGA